MPEDNNINSLAEQIRRDSAEGKINIDTNKILGAAEQILSTASPLESTGLEQTYTPDSHEFDQGFLNDLGSGIWNSLVIGGGEGVANLIPTVGQAMGSESEFLADWKSGVSEWFKGQETIYSDKANQPIEGFGDITSAHIAQGLGQGIGFILGIAGGSSVGGASQTATRIGSYMTGTTLMYPMIDKEAKEAGLSDVDAARFALGVSGLVSLTEGAALEWIGKTASKPLTASITSKAVRETLKGASTKNPMELQKLFLSNFGKRLGGNVAKMTEASAVEMGQEFSQTYIEEGAKQLWDATTKDKGKFGSDITSYQTFVEATFGGIIGGLIGGGMGAANISRGGTDLAKESLFGYINSSINNGNFENINKINTSVDEMFQNGKITEQDSKQIKSTVEDLAQFATDYGKSDIKNGTALYQLFQLDGAKKKVNSFKESLEVSDSANETLKKHNEEKKSKIDLVAERVQANFDSVFESKKPETKNKVKFEDKLMAYENVVNEIESKNISEEEVNKKLDKIFNPKLEAENKAKKQEAKQDYGEVRDIDGVKLTEKSIQNKEAIRQKFNEALSKEGKERQDIIDEVQKEYGIDKEGMNYIDENYDSLDVKKEESPKVDEVKPIEKVETTTESLISQVNEQQDLTEKDLDAIQMEADEKEISSPELIDAIANRREKITIKPTAEKIEKKPTIETTEKQDVTNIKKAPEKIGEKNDESIDDLKSNLMSNSSKVLKINEELNDLEDFYSKEDIDNGIGQKLKNEIESLEKESEAIMSEIQKREQEKPTPQPKTESTKEPIATEEVTTPTPTMDKPASEMSDAELKTIVESGNATDEQLKEISDEQGKRKEDAAVSFMRSFDPFAALQDADNESKEQRSSVGNENFLVKNNQALYEKIKGHFRKIFPNIPLTEVNALGEKYGAKILGRLVERGIEIDTNSAIQTTLIHEYAHVYLEVLGENHPLVKLGYSIIEGTSFDEDAKRLYPDKTRNEQLNEALTEALAQDSLEKLRVKFEGSTLEKFIEFAKRFWRRIKKPFTKSKSSDVISILSDNLILNNKPYSVGLSSLVGINKNQLSQSINPRFLQAINLTQFALNAGRLKSIDKVNVGLNMKNVQDATRLAMDFMFKQYQREKLNLPIFGDKMFSDLDLGSPDVSGMNNNQYTDALRNFAKELKQKDIGLYNTVDKVVKSITKNNLDVEAIEDVVEDAAQNDDSGKSDNSIKADKKVNLSVRSILSSLVDYNGSLINSDEVFTYVGNVSNNTLGQEGFIQRLMKDAENGNLLADRLLSINQYLGNEEKKGLFHTLSSLTQIEYEGSNLFKDTEKGTYKLTNRTLNLDTTYFGLESKLNKASESTKEFFSKKNIIDNGFFQAISNLYLGHKVDGYQELRLEKFLEEFSKLIGQPITKNELIGIIDNFSETKSYKKHQNFGYFLYGDKASLVGVIKGKNKISDIGGYIRDVFNALGVNPIQNMFMNGANNMVSSTQTGHWVSELNSLLFNSDRMATMKKSPIYKDNTVLKHFDEQGTVNYVRPDSIRNLNTGENVEYNDMTAEDYQILQFHKFAANNSSKVYKQTLGVMSNRDSMLMFEVPRYNDAQLKNEYIKQANQLQETTQKVIDNLDETNKMLKDDKKVTKQDVINDFNNLYLHQAKLVDGKVVVTNGIDVGYKSEINKLKKTIGVELQDAYRGTTHGETYSSFDSMVENFFFTEALNRTYLGDIYGGSSIQHSAIKKGMAVEHSVKRMSGPSSNGEHNQIDKPIVFVVYDGSGSDSFNINGSKLSEQIAKDTGSFDVPGMNSKDQIYQVDPITSEVLYAKNSSLNLKRTANGNNLYGMSSNDSKINYATIGDAIIRIEDYLEQKYGKDAPYVKLIDKKGLKGTMGGYEVIGVDELVNATDISTIANKFSKPIDVVNHRTLFNISKKLKSLSEQEAIFSTQAMLIQFNNITDKANIEQFDKLAVDYLNNKMGGKYDQSRVFTTLMSFNNVLDELTKDLNDREKSATTDILNAIIEYNKANPDNQIESLDDPSTRKIFEQFVSSRLSKKGIKIDLPGNFLHQLPDVNTDENTKLKYDEVAVPYKMFANTLEEANKLLESGADLKVAVVRIPASAEMSMFAGKVKYFLDTDENMVTLSDEFVRVSDSDHDGDKAMVYRQELDDNGIIKPYSLKSRMFDHFYNNLKDGVFSDKALNGTLEFEKLADLSDGKSEYKTASIQNFTDIAHKMGFGQEATGKFAIASKLMSLLSQSGSSLNEQIQFNGKPLKDFKNTTLSDMAILLQAALDIGNDPVLTTTGFNGSTIDVGSAMLLLGVDIETTVKFLQQDGIKKLVKDFESTNSAFSQNEKKSFNQFLQDDVLEYSQEASGMIIPTSSLERYGEQTIRDFMMFKGVSKDLVNLIGFIQLDKSLPNSSVENQMLLDGIDEFEDLSFNVNGLMKRGLYEHRKQILDMQSEVYGKQLLVSSPNAKKVIKRTGKLVGNEFEFNKRAEEQIAQYVSQFLLNNKRTNAKEFMYSLPKKIQAIQSSLSGDTNLEAEDYVEAIVDATSQEEIDRVYDIYGSLDGGRAKIDKEVKAYREQLLMLEDAQKYQGNIVFDYITFKDTPSGVAMSLSPKFKATSEIQEKFRKDFEALQKLDPELANEIIDYQLYRFGLNNKMGSFIDGLPLDINIRFAKKATQLKNSGINQAEMQINLLSANQDLMPKVKGVNSVDKKGLEAKAMKKPFVTYEGNIYVNKDTNKPGTSYIRFNNGKFDSDENFTAYNVAYSPSSTTQADINENKKNCN